MIDNYRPQLGNAKQTYVVITLSARMSLFLFLSLALHPKTINLKLEPTYIFSIIIHVFVIHSLKYALYLGKF